MGLYFKYRLAYCNLKAKIQYSNWFIYTQIWWRKMKKYTLAIVFLALASLSYGQSVCSSNPGPFYVTSARPFTVEWVMDVLAPVSDTDPTLVPVRVDGYYYQIDFNTEVKILVADTIPGPVCAAGTTYAGKTPYTWHAPQGVAKGSHTLKLLAWNYTLDANGIPTTTEQRSPIANVPFIAVDLAMIGPPTVPKGTIIKR